MAFGLPLGKLCFILCSKKLEIRLKDFHTTRGSHPHTFSKEFGFGTTFYMNLHYVFILSIILIFNIFQKMPIMQETNFDTDNPMPCKTFLLLGFIGNYKILFRVN